MISASIKDSFTKDTVVPRRRILYIDHTAALGGGEFALLNLVQHLDLNRFQPIVLLSCDGPLLELLKNAHVETHVIPLDSEVGDTRKESLGLRGMLRIGTVWRTLRYSWRIRQFISQ